MHQTMKTSSFCALLLSMTLGGCTFTTFTAIRNPLQVGQVDQNHLATESSFERHSRGLPPGMLVDRASLTELSPERVCALTELWSVDDTSGREAYPNYSIVLLNDQDGVENSQAEIELGQATVTPTPGHIARRVQVGTRRVCAERNRRNDCVRWRREPVFDTRYFPYTWNVVRQPARVCFSNAGFITTSSQRVAMEFRAHGSPSRFVFEWRFDPNAPSLPAQPVEAQVSEAPAPPPAAPAPTVSVNGAATASATVNAPGISASASLNLQPISPTHGQPAVGVYLAVWPTNGPDMRAAMQRIAQPHGWDLSIADINCVFPQDASVLSLPDPNATYMAATLYFATREAAEAFVAQYQLNVVGISPVTPMCMD